MEVVRIAKRLGVCVVNDALSSHRFEGLICLLVRRLLRFDAPARMCASEVLMYNASKTLSYMFPDIRAKAKFC